MLRTVKGKVKGRGKLEVHHTTGHESPVGEIDV
jgi:hypothetical protein